MGPRLRRRVVGLVTGLVFGAPALADHATCFASVSALTPNAGDAVLRHLLPENAEELAAKGYTFPDAPLAGASQRPGCSDQTRALVVFSVPRQQVLALLIQTERQDEFLEDLRSVRRVAAGRRDKIDEHQLKVLFTSLTYRVHNHWDETSWHIWWQLDDSFENDLRDLRGYWQLYDLADGRTLAVYGTQVDVGAAVPKGLQDLMTRKTIRRAVHQFREWVDEEGQGKR